MFGRNGWWVVAVLLLAGALLLGCEAKKAESTAEGAEGEKAATKIAWRADHDAALSDAAKAGKPAIIDFTASWCAPCKKLDEETFSDPRVIEALSGFVAIRVDGSETIEAVEKEMNRHGVASFPTVVFVDKGGKTLSEPRIEDFVPADEFLKLVAKASK